MLNCSKPVLVIKNADKSESAERYQYWLRQNEGFVLDILADSSQLSLDSWPQIQQAACILLDLQAPGDATLEVLNWLMTSGGDACPPIIVLGDDTDVDTAVRALKSGAADYLIRSTITSSTLQQAIVQAQTHAFKQQEQRHWQQLIETIPICTGIGTTSSTAKMSHDVMGMSWPGSRDEPVTTAVDCLPLQQAETELKRQEAELRLVTDTIPALVSFIDTTQCYRFNNQRYEDWFGYPTSELYGWHIQDVLGQANYERLRPYVEQALAGQEVAHESRILDKNGNGRYVSATYVPRFDQRGNVIGVVSLAMDISDRIRTEKALRRSEDRLRIALESAQLGTWDWNFITGNLVWDAHCKAIFGVPPGTHISIETFYQALHPDDHGRLKQTIADVLAPGSEGRYEVEYRITGIQDGVERWILAKGQAYFQDNGAPKRFIGTVLDITDRKRIETVLREGEERLQMALDGSEGGYWDWNIVTNEDYLSPRWLQMLGYEVGDLPAEYDSWVQLIHPDDRDWVTERLQAHLQDSSVPYKFEYRLLSKSGDWKWIANYGRVVVHDSQGRPSRMAGIHYDVSDRKLTEERLRQSEDRLRMAVESAQMGTWDWNLKTKEINWDDRCKAIFGLPPETDVTLKIIFAGFHPDDRMRIRQVIRWSLNPASNGDCNIEYRTIGIRDGIQRWVAAKGQVYFEDGVPNRFIGTLLDISERKRVEAEREQLLEREQAARREAERANRIKDEFLAILSHELRSPLNPILGWSKLMQTKPLDQATTTRALSTIERNAKLQTQLIDDLLDIAKILRGKLKIENAPVDLQFIVLAAIDTVETAATAKSIKLQFSTSDSEATQTNSPKFQLQPPKFLVSGDPTRLQQIVWNLLSNAIKFTPSGGAVTIQLRPAGDQIQILVTDNGKGIGPDFLPHIFESFRQEDVSITRQFGGLGLGLAIVRYLTEAHGGEITADSPGEGLGATFTVSLPLLHPEGTMQSRGRSPNRNLDSDLNGLQILVIDDDVDSRELLEVALTQHGAAVETAASGTTALALLDTSPPDMLISDIGMPGMDGYALIQQVRSRPTDQGGQVPAIALTAYAREDDEQQALMSGFQRHLAKPVDIAQLLQTVITLIRTSQNIPWGHAGRGGVR